jgi:hypothetical protein
MAKPPGYGARCLKPPVTELFLGTVLKALPPGHVLICHKGLLVLWGTYNWARTPTDWSGGIWVTPSLLSSITPGKSSFLSISTSCGYTLGIEYGHQENNNHSLSTIINTWIN